MRDRLFIGELAERAGVSRKAIRLYEAGGLLPTPRRTATGYRVYGASTVRTVRFIAQARGLGFRLDEVRDIIKLRKRGQRPCCSHVLQLAGARLAELDRMIATLRHMQRGLRALLRRRDAAGDAAMICPHIEGIRRRNGNGIAPGVALPLVRPLSGGRRRQ